MNIKLLFTTILISASTYAQVVLDSIYMQAGYTNESYYSLADGEAANVDNTTWDLAFGTSSFGVDIRINNHTSTKLWVYPGATNAYWSSFSTSDTVGMNNWDSFYNGEEYWDQGALNMSADPANMFDVGWGIYNSTTHQIIGDSIHIIKLSNGDYKKLMIESMIGGVFSFKYADLDGSNEVTATITKSDFTGKNYGFYSLQNNTELDREPLSADWDIVFTKYITEYAPGVPYGVTGVLSNIDISVREALGVDPSTANYLDYTADDRINTIGWDWKRFTGGVYVTKPDTSFFVEDQNMNLWQLIFTKFEGSSTGKIVFSKELKTAAELVEAGNISALHVYPNPASSHATVAFHAYSDQVELNVYNAAGSLVASENLSAAGFVNYNLDLTSLNEGLYYIQLNSAGNQVTEKLIIH